MIWYATAHDKELSQIKCTRQEEKNFRALEMYFIVNLISVDRPNKFFATFKSFS